ncbi:putative membrane protein [Rhizomicrobium palustre]|jgi:uncharacterized membrane protein|uniref:Putative membrane protein n=1 Tax=Rhizomicrobium palustre TaxID=189966 RepID=A0A846MZK8_9PROT|nr:DUF979 domain-containing protein [Rhizomicrobium palustre]NIK88390.1 putative membrane protein [Rhizomicrobium palustre]
MIGLETIYVLAGGMFAAFAFSHAVDRANPARWRSTLFWGVFATLLILGSYLPHFVSGVMVLVLVGLAWIGLKPGPDATTDEQTRKKSAARLGNALFIAALAIPVVTLAGTLAFPHFKSLVDAKHVTLIALALGATVGLLLAMSLTRAPLSAAAAEGRRLVDSIGWATVLPQMLAALGGMFAAAGVGAIIAKLTSAAIPMSDAHVAQTITVVVYTCGMALFTMIMGNAFAAFPVMTAGIGLPLIVGKFGGDPVVMSALGMLSGFCGTLMTPMAANFNIVPAAVLELKDRNAVIKVQIPTALLLLFANTVLMSIFVYR